MSLVQREPRSLKRDRKYRDDRLFIVACDDQYAPKQYFDFFEIARVQVEVVETPDGSSHAARVLERLLEKRSELNSKNELLPDDELWMLLDVDHCGTREHLRSFVDTLAKARKQDVKVALSKPCFEVWLLLHHLEEHHVASLSPARKVEAALRSTLGEYNKTNLKREHYPLASVAEACLRASRLDARVAGGKIPQTATTRVYKIWESIVTKALPTQLPRELRDLFEPIRKTR